MADDPKPAEIEEEVIVDETPQEETPESTETPEVVEDEVEPKEETPEAETEPDEQPEEKLDPQLSRRANNRIQDLTRKLAEAQSQPQYKPQQQRQIIGEGDYDLDQVNGMAEQYGQQRYSEGLAQANALAFSTRLEIDAPKVTNKFPILDQNSDNFDPGVSAFINESYLKTVGYDPQIGTVQNNNIRYEEYVDGMMAVMETLSQGKQADSQKNLAKQAAQTGIRPSGVSKTYSGTDPSKMSLEQLQSAALAEAKAQKF